MFFIIIYVFGGFKIKFKRIFLLLLVFIVSFLMISSVSAGFLDIFPNADSSIGNDEHNLVVGFNSEFPPFGYNDNGNFTGFDLDLAQEVCKRNNWTFVPTPIIDWQSKEAELNSGAIDCLWSEFTINGREDDYTWSDPYFNNSQVFVVKEDSGIDSIDDLKGKTVEVQIASSALDSLNEKNQSLKNSFGELTQVKEYNTAFMDLESGACDAVLGDIGIMNYHLQEQFAGKGYKILDTQLSYEQYGIGFKKGNTELKNQVQKTLNEMFEDGTVDKIAQKYKDYDIPDGLVYP